MLARNSKTQIFLSAILFLLGGVALNNVIAKSNFTSSINSTDFVFGEVPKSPKKGDPVTAYGPKPQ